MKGPPKYLLRFFRWFCRPKIAEDIEGDLVEKFHKNVEVFGVAKARRKFFWQIMGLFRPGIVRSIFTFINYQLMFRHNIKIAWRNALKYKRTTILNLTGLSSALAVSFFIMIWVAHERSYDKYNLLDDQLYQVMHNIPTSEGISTGESTPGHLASVLSENIPEVKNAVSIVPASWFDDPGIISLPEKRTNVRAQYVGQSFFDVFTCNFISGDETQFTDNQQAILISNKLAIQLFGSVENALNQTVNWIDEELSGLFIITGIFQSLPENVSDPYDVLFNYSLFLKNRPFLENWQNSDPSTYFILKEGAEIANAKQKINSLYKNHVADSDHFLTVRKFSDQYLFNRFENGVQSGGRIEYVRLFTIIAILLLLAACINFTNLSTARSTLRAKEVGVKKTFGIHRNTLILQFLTESVLIVLLSLMLAIGIVYGTYPFFQEIVGHIIPLSFNLLFLLKILGCALLVGIIAGIYPAFYLTKTRTSAVLKGVFNNTKAQSGIFSFLLRRSLTTFQFITATVLIISIIFIHSQVRYLSSKNLGFDSDQIVHFHLPVEFKDDPEFFEEGGELDLTIERFKERIKNIPGVISVSNYFHNLTGDHGGLSGLDWQEGEEDSKIQFDNLEIGYDFFETMNIKFVAGRPYSKEFGNERSKLIINKKAAEIMNMDDPVEQTITFWGQPREIVGVTTDFHFESLYEEINPLVMQLLPGNNIMVKMHADQTKLVLEQLEDLYVAESKLQEFEYSFLDEDFERLYASENQLLDLSFVFTFMSVLITCLGLLGMATFIADSRSKEIGIRKVLGASKSQVVALFTHEFSKTILISFLISVPLAMLLMRQWLNQFAYHAGFTFWPFLVACLLVLGIALLTISFQTVKSANINPVDTIRNE